MSGSNFVYRASSILKNFVGNNAVKVEWFDLVYYNDDPYLHYPEPNYMLSEDDWSRVIKGYRKLDRRERSVARIYAFEFFVEYQLEQLRAFTQRVFNADISLERFHSSGQRYQRY